MKKIYRVEVEEVAHRQSLPQAGPMIEPGLEAIFAACVLILSSLLLAVARFGPHQLSPQESPFDFLIGGLTVGVGFAWVASVVYLFGVWHDKPEKVRVSFADGTIHAADVCGASKIEDGHARRAKVRFYLPDGSSAWTSGDGFRIMSVSRLNGRLNVQ